MNPREAGAAFYRVRTSGVASGMKQTFFSLFAGVAATALFCVAPSAVNAAEPTKAIAVLSSASGSEVVGTVTFTSGSDGVKVVADITGLKPGKHGFHVHEFGDCSAKDGTSAGGHYNPTKHPHAGPDAEMRHMGDLGNIEADESGKAHVEMTDKTLKLSGENSIVGYAVIVHEKADDLKSQPTGDAGGRVACAASSAWRSRKR